MSNTVPDSHGAHTGHGAGHQLTVERVISGCQPSDVTWPPLPAPPPGEASPGLATPPAEPGELAWRLPHGRSYRAGPDPGPVG